MNKVVVNVLKLEHFDSEFQLPSYQTEGAAGADIKASFPLEQRSEGLTIKPFERVLIPTGLAMEIPQGYEVQVRPRSGLSFKTTLMVVNSPGTIDSDYRGEVKIILANIGQDAVTVEHGERLAQLVLAPVTQADFVVESSLSETDRGAGGFGSTGVK